MLVLHFGLDLDFLRAVGLDSLSLRPLGTCEPVWLELGAGTSIRFVVPWSRQLGPRNAVGRVGSPCAARAMVWLRSWWRERLRVEKLPPSRFRYLSAPRQFCQRHTFSWIPLSARPLRGWKNHRRTTPHQPDSSQPDAGGRKPDATCLHQRRSRSTAQHAGANRQCWKKFRIAEFAIGNGANAAGKEPFRQRSCLGFHKRRRPTNRSWRPNDPNPRPDKQHRPGHTTIGTTKAAPRSEQRQRIYRMDAPESRSGEPSVQRQSPSTWARPTAPVPHPPVDPAAGPSTNLDDRSSRHRAYEVYRGRTDSGRTDRYSSPPVQQPPSSRYNPSYTPPPPRPAMGQPAGPPASYNGPAVRPVGPPPGYQGSSSSSRESVSRSQSGNANSGASNQESRGAARGRTGR